MAPTTPPAVLPYLDSPRTLHLAGLPLTIFGLPHLPAPGTPLTLVQLLHPRLGTSARMHPHASAILSTYHSPSNPTRSTHGLLVVTFDQRNHGHRLNSSARNDSWREGNATHAVDLFSSYEGTAKDASSVIDYIDSVLFPGGDYEIVRHVVAGVSLGGHSSWLAVLNDPRVSAAGVIIGCADFEGLMRHRAGRSRVEGFVVGDSAHYTAGLEKVVGRVDPVGVLKSRGPEEVARRLRGKSILVLSGGADKLVPWDVSKEFVEKVQGMEGFRVESVVYEGVGHECTEEMTEKLARWVRGVVNQELQAKV